MSGQELTKPARIVAEPPDVVTVTTPATDPRGHHEGDQFVAVHESISRRGVPLGDGLDVEVGGELSVDPDRQVALGKPGAFEHGPLARDQRTHAL